MINSSNTMSILVAFLFIVSSPCVSVDDIKLVKVLEGHTNSVYMVYSDADYIYTTSWDKTVRVWRKSGFSLVTVLEGHTNLVVDIHVDANYIYTASSDASVRVWSKSDYSPVKVLDHPGYVQDLSLDEDYIFTASWNGNTEIYEARVWTRSDFSLAAILRGHINRVVNVHANADYIFTGSTDSTIRVWNRSDFSLVKVLDAGDSALYSMDIDANFIYAPDVNDIRVWRLSDLTSIQVTMGHSEPITNVFVDDIYVYTSSRDGTARVWNKSNYSLVKVLEGHTDLVREAFSYDKYIITASHDNTARVWSKSDFSLVKVLEGHTETVHDVYADSEYFYTASIDNTIRVWQSATPKTCTIIEDCDYYACVDGYCSPITCATGHPKCGTKCASDSGKCCSDVWMEGAECCDDLDCSPVEYCDKTEHICSGLSERSTPVPTVPPPTPSPQASRPSTGSPTPSSPTTTTPRPTAVSNEAPSPTSPLVGIGSPCTTNTDCPSMNCKNRVCCGSGMNCCTLDKQCGVGEECDTERFYCVPEDESAIQRLQRDPVEFFLNNWELLGAMVMALSTMGYYLHTLKRKTLGEEKVKIKRGVTREGNIIKIGVKVVNGSTFPLVDVGVELDVPSAFRIEGGSKFIDIGVIKPGDYQSAIFKLIPSRCVSGTLTGSVGYLDNKGKKKHKDIEPVTVGSVCPFLEKVPMDMEMFKEKVRVLPSHGKRITVHATPEHVLDSLEGKCSSMHLVKEDTSLEGNRVMAAFSARGAYSKNFIGLSLSLDKSSGELIVKVYGEQEEMVTGLLSEIVEIIEDVNE